MHSEPLEAPSGLVVDLRNSPTEIVFRWNPETVQCLEIEYIISSTNCGVCTSHNSSSISAVCRDFTLTSNDNICTFGVQSILCGNLTSAKAELEVNLKGN